MFEIETICNSIVNTSKLEDHVLGHDYLILWKDYSRKKNIFEPTLVVLDLCKLINIFYYNYFKNITTTFLLINSALLIARPTIRPEFL